MIDNRKRAIDLIKKLTAEDVALPGVRVAENGSLRKEGGKKAVASVKKKEAPAQ
jgi:hypothetical protein